jgi:dihydrofolate reductase (trimethoprim resistance protein)
MFEESHKTYNLGDYVRKKSGSHWEGKIVGMYKTKFTEEGYCIESMNHPGSVQIYPATALEYIWIY